MTKRMPGMTKTILCTKAEKGGIVDWFTTNNNAWQYASNSDAFPRSEHPQVYIITITTDLNSAFNGVHMAETLWWSEEDQMYRATGEWANESQIEKWSDFIERHWDDVRALRGFTRFQGVETVL